MSLAKIVWAVSALAAIILAFVNTGHDSMILALLGLASGWFLDHDHRRGVIIAAIFLMMGGSSALNGIMGIGEHLGAILGALGAVFSAASVMAIVRTLVERIVLSNKAATTE
jgi:MFS family permease